MIKSILCGLFVSGLLFGCSHYNDRVSATADSSSKDTTASVLDTKEVSSPYIDTLLITFSDNQPYTIYVEEYSKEGPEGSLRHFVMVDPQGKEVFRSFEKQEHIEFEDFEEKISFEMIPGYQILSSVTQQAKQIAVGLYLKDNTDDDPDFNINADEVLNRNAFAELKPLENQKGEFYIYGYLATDNHQIKFTTSLSYQKCFSNTALLIDSLDKIKDIKIYEISYDKVLSLHHQSIKCFLDTMISPLIRKEICLKSQNLTNNSNYKNSYPMAVSNYILNFLAYHILE